MKVLNSEKEPYKSYGGFGVDVAERRTDDIDKKILEHLRGKSEPRVLDLGSGAGGQSFRMVEAGAFVTAIDIYDFSNEFAEYRKSQNVDEERLKFIYGDITKISEYLTSEKFTDVSMQRTLHYLPYLEAVELLTFLRTIVSDKLFISVTGMNSAVGDNYGGREVAIESRFIKLEPVEADIFQILAPVCLYTEDEFVTLLKKTGWEVEEVWQSAFGNIKAICR